MEDLLLITDELIEQRLEEQGIDTAYHNLDITEKLDFIQKRYEFSYHTDWGSDHYGMYCYSESTADGYSVYVLTRDPSNISVSQDIHYYTYDIADDVKCALKDGLEIYFEDLYEDFVEQAVDELYEEVLEELREKIIDDLREDGYEYKDDFKTFNEAPYGDDDED